MLTFEGYRSQALSTVRKNLNEASQELGKQRSKAQELEGHVADRDRELMSLKTDRTLSLRIPLRSQKRQLTRLAST